ncbi:MAG: SIMPL domain-containing protein [Rhodobacteraceae bacterium]|nr:SIMPL domain-containing protein [Paracoccaceae bacterium]
MKRTAFAAIAGLALMAGAALAQAAPTERTITVTGLGSVETAPDMAWLQLGVVSRASSADLALADMARSLKQVMTTLEAQGVDPSRVQTQGLGLFPLRSNTASARAQGAEIQGFEAQSRLQVEILDLPGLGGIIDAAVRSGANDLANLSFGIQDIDAKTNEARQAAMADAMATARLYADAAGLRLGAVQSITETGSAPRPEMMGRAMMAEAAVPIAGGEVSVTARVTLVIALTE